MKNNNTDNVLFFDMSVYIVQSFAAKLTTCVNSVRKHLSENAINTIIFRAIRPRNTA